MERKSKQAEQADGLGANFGRELRRQRRNHLWRIGSVSLLCLLLLVIWHAACNANPHVVYISTATYFYVFMALWTAVMLFVAGTSRRERNRRRRFAAQLVSQDDIRSIGPLIDLLSFDDRQTHQIAKDALARLLPRIQAMDEILLNQAQRTRLCRILADVPHYMFRRVDDEDLVFNKDMDLCIAILQAFACIGDSKVLPVVNRLVKDAARTAGQKRLQEAAHMCLSALQLRAEQERNSQMLLRATNPAATASESLLRSTERGQENEPAQLLRAGELEP